VRCIVALLPLALCAADRLSVPLGLDHYVPAPADNPLRREVVELGRRLFFDKGLSRDSTVACATCHDPTRAFTDNKPIAIGIRGQLAGRRSPPILNRAWGKSFFWDGRASTLEQQVLEPIANPKEMDLPIDALVERLAADSIYRQRFQEVFRSAPSATNLARALGGYVRTILSGASPYDHFVAGRRDALTAEQQIGLRLFRGKANCASCHVGPNLTDEDFHNTGTAWRDGAWSDPGRVVISNHEAHRGAFKTPSLREVVRVAPYMHDGSIGTLEEVIEFYDKGGRENPLLDPEIRPLRLTAEERRALLAFLEALSGTVQEGWPQ